MESNNTPHDARIRAVFLDIDGTLIGPDNIVSPGVRAALQATHRQGVEVVLCTGRARFTTRPIAEQLGIPLGYAITSNGGVAMHLGTGEVLYRRLLTIPIALQVINAIVDAGAEPYVYEDTDGDDVESARVLHHPELPTGPFATPPRYRPHADILTHLPFHPVSVSAYGPAHRIRPLAARLQESLPSEVAIIQSGSEDGAWGVEIFAHGVDKRLGLETVAAHLGVAREEVMAIGDHLNDLAMLQWAGLGIAMGNAIEEARAVADYITDTREQDGVAKALARFVL